MTGVDVVDRTALQAQVLVVGAGPVGLMTAIELRRRGVDVLIVDSRSARAPWAKAVGVQPRTLEIFDAIGIARDALDAATLLRGQLTFVNGQQRARLDLTLPDSVPYHFIALPQYETEDVLAAHLATLGVEIRRDCEAVDVSSDADGVTVSLIGGGAHTRCRAEYLVGCDGAHSVVRKSLGLGFEGDAFPESYMLADVEVDWDVPTGYAIRSSHETNGVAGELLVCIPLPGERRYRMSMLAPDELLTPQGSSDGVTHGLGAGRAPQLRHIQAVLDRLAPQPTTAHTMRWSSVFRISHRLVERYSAGRVFLAGDAAHIHPPTGAQGMNTGLQDAFNLGWKLAMVLTGRSDARLLDSYHAERHPVGEEVVGRTVKNARTGLGGGETSVETLMLREAQLLVGYPESPLVSQDVAPGAFATGPAPGMRAPDAAGLRQDLLSHPFRLHELFRHPEHTLLLWAGDEAAVSAASAAAARFDARAPGLARTYVLAPAGAVSADVSGRVLRDAQGAAAAAYGFGSSTGKAVQSYLIRPDGYVSYRSDDLSDEQLARHLSAAYGLPPEVGAS